MNRVELEREVKILNIDIGELEEKLIQLKAELITREEQENILIDSSVNPISSNVDAYLRIRIRRDLITGEEEHIFTLKERGSDGETRVNMEYSTVFEDVKALLTILDKIGYNLIERGYKKRTSYSLKGFRIDLDTWDEATYPYPYAEIEVCDDGDLKSFIEELGIDYENVSTKSIVQLQNELISN